MCPPGFYKRGVLARTCEACPKGFYGTNTSASHNGTCIQCPPGKYADRTGMLTCSDCLDSRYTTYGGGKTNPDACLAVPRYDLHPKYPEENTKTVVEVFWYKYSSPDQDAKTIDVYVLPATSISAPRRPPEGKLHVIAFACATRVTLREPPMSLCTPARSN